MWAIIGKVMSKREIYINTVPNCVCGKNFYHETTMIRTSFIGKKFCTSKIYVKYLYIHRAPKERQASEDRFSLY